MTSEKEHLKSLVEAYREKALREHAQMRHWQNRALAAESQLKDSPKDHNNAS